MSLGIIFLLMCVLLPVVEPACAPVEEGKPTTLDCAIWISGCPSDVPLVTWRTKGSNPVTVITCYSNGCRGPLSPSYFSATIIINAFAKLTIKNVSRTVPFNMETEWECLPCVDTQHIVNWCPKVEIYALPLNPVCQVTENLVSGDIQSVTFSCTCESVYPRAKCSLYTIKDGGNPVKITKFLSNTCSVTLSVLELGVGTHSFLGKIYPDVADGESKVNWTIPTPNTAVTLSFPQVNHTCITNKQQGFFVGTSASCTCSITVDGKPRGTPQWYNRANIPVGTAGVLNVMYDQNNPVQTFNCEARSDLGRNLGSNLAAQFAFHLHNSVQAIPQSSPIKLCNNNNQADVECRISRGNVNPPPTFSFSLDGLIFSDPQPGTKSGDNYKQTFSFSRDVGGEHQVFCRVTNAILDTTQDKTAKVVFQKPPPGPPQVTISSQTFQGTVSTNIVTLAEGYSGDVTCRVEGGFPDAIDTKLECDQLKNTSTGNTATLSFKNNLLRKDMNGTVCTCTGSHVSGCYSSKTTMATLHVTYPPEVTFTKDNPETTFNKGDSVSFACSAQGNPDPTMIMTRGGTDDSLKGPQTTSLTHTMDSLDCLDTGVYVCSGQNSQGRDSNNIVINVRCPQQFPQVFKPQPVINAVIGSNARIDLEVYGFPEPTSLTLKVFNGTDITTSGRHIVSYTAGDGPLGNVSVTIFDIIESDYTIYSLSVGNGVGPGLTYAFSLNKDLANEDTEKSSGYDSLRTTAIIIALIAVVTVASLVVIIVFILRRYQNLKRTITDTGLNLTPIDHPDIVHNVAAFGAPRPGQCKDVDNVRDITNLTHNTAGLAPESTQDRDTTGRSPAPHVLMVSASERPETNLYETIPDTVTPPFGPYNSTSPQDVEPLAMYNRAILETPSTTNFTSAENYSNIPGQTLTHDPVS